MSEVKKLDDWALEAYRAYKNKDLELMEELIEIIGKEYLKKYAIKKHFTDFYIKLSQMR